MNGPEDAAKLKRNQVSIGCDLGTLEISTRRGLSEDKQNHASF